MWTHSATGEFISKECGGIVPERDEQDIAIVKYVIEATSKPILGDLSRHSGI